MMQNATEEVFKIFENDWNKQVILYGPPGTSKTYSSTIIAARLLGCEKDDFGSCKEYLEKDDIKKDLHWYSFTRHTAMRILYVVS